MRITEEYNRHFVVPQNEEEEMAVRITLTPTFEFPFNLKNAKEVYSDYGIKEDWSLFLKTYDMLINKGGKK